MSSKPVRVRFAPSPTGYLHVGGARTALYNYLYAKKMGGKFILRIEDTDLERSTEEALRMQIADLKWLKLYWDEGPQSDNLEDKGDFGPYRQSQRKEIYQRYADQLLEEGYAYYCFMTDEEIDAQREELVKAGKPPQVQSPYRDLPMEEAKKRIEAGEKPVIRFRVGEKKDYTIQDMVRGEVVFPSDMVGDFVLIRSNGMPVYNFCCAIDDALMDITHVFRAEEHLSNTLRQLMIYEALGFWTPEFGHLSIILGADKQKLSKRHGATSCNEFRLRGYLPEALLNFIALLGWSDAQGREVMSMEELIQAFDPERLHQSSAVFDEQKLLWMNSVHLRNLSHDDLWNRLRVIFDKEGLKFSGDEEWVDRALDLFKTSMETLNDAIELFRPLSETKLKIEDSSLEVLSWESTPKVIGAWLEELKEREDKYLTEEDFGNIQNKIKDQVGVKGKHLFMPIRVAVIGKPQGAELKELVPLLKREVLIQRADEVLNR
ncbi:MAG TPA: glutamate--tRNA ligase [Bdellovibrionales bacterium]|nr:glutamate--tRNA ligase [Pseudobdellovibrionaceae bacterium]HAG90235.1 glutamate--tRNA ligase [Bdellovibrionales bacterium]